MKGRIKNLLLILSYLKELSESNIDFNNNKGFFEGYSKTVIHCSCCTKEIWLVGNGCNSVGYDELLSYALSCGWSMDNKNYECPKCRYLIDKNIDNSSKIISLRKEKTKRKITNNQQSF